MKVEKVVKQVPVTTTKEVVRYKLELTERDAHVLFALTGNCTSCLLESLYNDLLESGLEEIELKGMFVDLVDYKNLFDKFSDE